MQEVFEKNLKKISEFFCRFLNETEGDFLDQRIRSVFPMHCAPSIAEDASKTI